MLAIAAIVSLGSISAGMNALIEEQMKLASDFIIVAEEGTFSFSSTSQSAVAKLPREYEDEILQVDGVEATYPQIRTLATGDVQFLMGMDLDDVGIFDLENIEFVEGGWPPEAEKELAMGYLTAEAGGWKVSDEVKVQDDTYVISGIFEEMGNFMDFAVMTTLEPAADTFDMGDHYTVIMVEPIDVSESNRIADEIQDLLDGVEAITSQEAIETARQLINEIGLMTLSIGIIASIVASIGIINTMIMIVLERKREFGIMKALGAERNTILSIVMQEAATIGAIGGVIGIAIGFVGTEAINQVIGMPLAALTPELIILSFAYGIILTILAAAYPAYKAISVDPVEAMRK
jgi:putative ABC transport system permease protein